MKVKVKFVKLRDSARVPTYASPASAGADLYSAEDGDVVIAPSETVLIHTGISAEIPDGYAGFVFARSGLAMKRDLAPANKVGVVDSDYRGEYMVALHNHGTAAQTVERGERVAQLVIMPYVTAEFEECDALSDTERGSGGFGSSGTH